MNKTITLLLLVILINSCELFSPEVKRSFSVESWRQYPDKRHEMSDDLIQNYLYKGMPKSEVEVLIGDPDYIYQSRYEYIMGSGLDYTYILYLEYNNELLEEYYEEVEYW